MEFYIDLESFIYRTLPSFPGDWVYYVLYTTGRSCGVMEIQWNMY